MRTLIFNVQLSTAVDAAAGGSDNDFDKVLIFVSFLSTGCDLFAAYSINYVVTIYTLKNIILYNFFNGQFYSKINQKQK